MNVLKNTNSPDPLTSDIIDSGISPGNQGNILLWQLTYYNLVSLISSTKIIIIIIIQYYYFSCGQYWHSGIKKKFS